MLFSLASRHLKARVWEVLAVVVLQTAATIASLELPDLNARIIDEGGRVLVGRGREHEGLASRPAGRDAGPLEAKPEEEQSSKAFSVFALRFVRVRHDAHSRKRIRSIALGDERREGPQGRRGTGGFNRTRKGRFGESGEGVEVKARGHVAMRN